MKKKIFICIIIVLLIFFFGAIINLYINQASKEYIYKNQKKVPSSYTALVLGAAVYRSGKPSRILKDRLLKAITLYRNKKVKKILVSGDHGKKYYDEVNIMKKFLLKKKVRKKDIFLDHAGFNTYNSIVRSKEIFQVKDVIIVTQEFHLPRALYIARKKGLNAYGFTADIRKYPKINRFKLREFFAKVKSFFEVFFNIDPKFYGPKIPIYGDSSLSWDKKN